MHECCIHFLGAILTNYSHRCLWDLPSFCLPPSLSTFQPHYSLWPVLQCSFQAAGGWESSVNPSVSPAGDGFCPSWQCPSRVLYFPSVAAIVDIFLASLYCPPTLSSLHSTSPTSSLTRTPSWLLLKQTGTNI